MLLGRKAMTNLDSVLKSRDITASKGLYSQSYGFPSSCVQMWELDHKEGWAPKNWCFWIVVLEKTLESSLESRVQTSQSYSKSALNTHWKDWCWSWSPNTLATWYKELTHWKRLWYWEWKGATEEEMIGWHHCINGHGFQQTLRDSEG